MTSVRVRRVAVRCVAPHAARERALDARTRLERVAAGPLAAALDRALGTVDADVRIDSLRVLLDIDVEAYDDETLAYLWASRIAAAAAPHFRAPAAEPSWVDALLGLAPYDLASVAALLGPRGLAGAVPAGSRDAVLAALRRVVPARAGSTAPTTPAQRAAAVAASSGTTTPATPGEPARPERAAGAVPPAPGAGSPATPARPPSPEASGSATPEPTSWEAACADATAAAPLVPSPAALTVASAVAPPSPRLPSDVFVSAAGGLVLLYPWLAAAVPECDLAPEDARRATYAALAGDASLQHDPLVRLLSGVAPGAPTPHVELEVDPEPVLRAFAGMLCGFETSSAAYLQEHLVLRAARIEPLPDAVLVRLARRPLDVVLHGLPYPLGVVRLPWTPPLAVDFRC